MVWFIYCAGLKSVVNAYSLFKRSCDLLNLIIIKVSDIFCLACDTVSENWHIRGNKALTYLFKLNFGRILIKPMNVMLSTHATWSSMGVSTRGFTKTLSLNIINRIFYAWKVSVQNLFWLYCQCWPHMLSFISLACAGFPGIESV